MKGANLLYHGGFEMVIGARMFLAAALWSVALLNPAMAGAVSADAETYIVSPAVLVEENTGKFISIFPTIEAAKTAALGNKTTQTMRISSEFLFLNNPCEDTFSYSLYFTDRRFFYKSNQPFKEDLAPQILAQVTVLERPAPPLDIEAIYDAKNPSPETLTDQRIGALYAQLQTFSYKRTADCEPLPLGIIFKNGKYKPFDRNNAGTSLVGTRFHDATVIEATRVTAEQAKTQGNEKLAAKGVANIFNDVNSAVAAAKRLPGDKVIILDGNVAHIYRADENIDVPGIGRQFKNLGEYVEALKKAKPDNGMTILALVVGNKGVVPISPLIQ